MLRFLVMNDDGIDSKGLQVLAKTLKPRGEVYVCAPDRQRSATAQSVTLFDQIRCQEVPFKYGEKAWTVSGTPADCAKFAIQAMEEEGKKIDFAFSGINHGSNAGTDIHYSGTVGAAAEAAMSGIRSIALSVDSWEPENFQFICDMIPELIEISGELDCKTVLNVNVPDLPAWKIKGVKILPMGPRSFNDRLVETEEGNIYRYKGVPQDHSVHGTSNDLAALHNGYAVVTPMSVDLTDRQALNRIRLREGGKVLCLMSDPVDTVIYDMWHGEKLRENLVRLSDALGRLGVYTILTIPEGRRGDVITPDITRNLDGSTTVERIGFTIFDEPDVAEKMREGFSGRNVVLAGAETHLALQSTALEFIDMGMNVTVLKDCCSSATRLDHETAIEYLRQKGCRITTSEAWAAEVGRATGKAGPEAISQIFR